MTNLSSLPLCSIVCRVFFPSSILFNTSFLRDRTNSLYPSLSSTLFKIIQGFTQLNAVKSGEYYWGKRIILIGESYNRVSFLVVYATSSSSIAISTLVGFGSINYRWVFSAGRFSQSAVVSGTSNPQLGGPVIRTFQLPLPGVPHIWNDASEPQQRNVELWARNCWEFCRKWRLVYATVRMITAGRPNDKYR